MNIHSTQRAFFTLGSLLIAMALIAQPSLAQTTAPSGRTPDAISADLQQTLSQFRDTIQGGQALRTAESRKQVAPKAIPNIHKILSLIDEMSIASPDAKSQLDGAIVQFRIMALILDDPQLTPIIQAKAAGSDLDSIRSKAGIAIADFIKASDDEGRNKALDAFDVALKLAPADPGIFSLIPMTGIIGSPSTAVYSHLLAIVKTDAQGQDAQQLVQEMEGHAKQMQMEGKPLVIAGITLNNPKFSTADWKGKVILVDFWATWCGPCLGELPRVKKMYADYHAKGLEILGVSCDNSGDDLKKFLAQNPDMPWPQQFDDKTPGWSPLATSYGIDSIPTMFLIDRKGVLRTVDARSKMEDLIPTLLAEKP